MRLKVEVKSPLSALCQRRGRKGFGKKSSTPGQRSYWMPSERLSQTWYNLELNSNAPELEQWCEMCGCLHTIDVLKEDGTTIHAASVTATPSTDDE